MNKDLKEISANIVICGAGIVGLTIARELVKRGYQDILILEKEEEIGLHASGRNSGVLHAGIYYSPDSKKASSCLKGNMLMKEYCKEKNLPILECGKVIVAKNDSEINTLNDLYNRAKANGADVRIINEKELAEIEPNARTTEKALYTSNTAVVDPKAVLKSIYEDLQCSQVVTFMFSTTCIGPNDSSSLLTNKTIIRFEHFINAAGSYSDVIAHKFEVGKNFTLIPFKGIYKKMVSKKSDMVRGNIYPVPDIRNPFLGVHFTKSVYGDLYLGPTAIPAFGRENYGILEGMSAEALSILYKDAKMCFWNSQFRRIAFEEPRKYIPWFFYKDAKQLVKELNIKDIKSTDKVGIRSQLIDKKSNELVMDFMVIKDSNCIHVLNAISPAFTSSMFFAQQVVDEFFVGF